MSELNDDQRSLLPTLIGRGTGSLPAGNTVEAGPFATSSLKFVVGVQVTSAADVTVENCNVVANANFAWRLKHHVGGTTGVEFINNTAGTVAYSFVVLGYT